MNKDLGKYLGSALMFGFGAVAFYRWHQTHLIFFLLLVLRDLAAGFFFLKRKPASSKSSLSISALAYLSAAMPLMYLAPSADTVRSFFLVADLLAILGFLLVAFATFELGTAIGISPANRGLVQSGIYRFIKHPMYTGYVISEMGLALLNPMNLWIFGLAISLYLLRGFWENQAIHSVIKEI